MSAKPVTTTNIRKRMPELRKWLVLAGAEVLEPTNEWELIRFRANGQTCIAYTNKRDHLTMDALTTKAVTAFFNGTSWAAHTKVKGKRTSVDETTIRRRDGDNCFFCCGHVDPNEASIEHLVAVSAKGPNHISNKFLAHRHCNSRAGSKSAPEKIAIHVKAMLEKDRAKQNRLREGAAADPQPHLPLAGMHGPGAAGALGVRPALVRPARQHSGGDLECVPARAGTGHEAQQRLPGSGEGRATVDYGEL